MSTRQNATSQQLIEIFHQKFQDLQEKEFSTILENFAEILSLLHKLQLLQYFIPYFKITPINGQSLLAFNVQRH